MKARNVVLAALAAAVTLTSVAAAGVDGARQRAAKTSAEGRNPVTRWNEIAVTTLISLPGPAGGAPPAAQINVGMVQGAVYDAVNAITPKHHRPYLLKRRFAATASEEAAVASAAYRMLVNIVSTVPADIPFPAKQTVLDTLALQYADSLEAIPDSPFKAQGIAAGEAAAEAMIEARADDGRFGPSPWVPNTAPGHWWPLTNPATGQPILDPTPWAGGVNPFVMQSPSQFRTKGPNALSSAAWAADYNEVKRLGSVNSADRAPEQTYIARWWQSTPVASWNAVARDLVARGDFDVADSARLFAMENLSAADAGINCWNDKYYWDFWRPWNAIPRGAEDGNPATEPDPTWAALITAPYPEHPSGHLCWDGAHTSVLRMFFGDVIEGGYQITSISTLLGPNDPRTRTFGSFSDALDELIEARIWAGLHYRTADVQARQLGENVADYMAAHYFQPVG
jgi:hypothetical protein